MNSESWNQGAPSGLGLRLREERKRLGKTQAEFAAAGGVGRLSQIQYENESTAPTTRYLFGISNVGVDLTYLFLGIRLRTAPLTTEQEERINKKAFELIEAYAEAQPDRRLGAESRRVLYQVLRSCLVQVELGSLPANFDLATLIPGSVANIAKA